MPSSNVERFGPFTLLVEEYRLLEDGMDVVVEPKALELIAHLVSHRGSVVSKDALLDSVWAGEEVGDAALSRCVHIARRALGEDARHSRWIQTVHGRGYRFSEEPPVVPGQPEAPSSNGGRRRWRMLWIPISSTLVAAILWMLASPPGHPPTPASEIERPASAGHPEILTLMAWTGMAKDRELALVAVSVVDLLHQQLAETEGLILRTPIYDQQAEAGEALLAGIAERTGASALLKVSVGESLDPERAKIAISLHEFGADGSRSTRLGQYSLPRLDRGASLDELLVLRDAVTRRIRDQLVPMLAGTAWGTRVGPRDSEAYRLYLMGYQRLRESYCGGAAGAIELFERSLEIDDRYAPTWLWLGVAHYNRVWACGADASAYLPAFDAIDRAAELDPELRQAHIQKAALLLETGRIARALEVLADELDRHGESPILLGTRSYALRIAGFLDLSLDDLQRLLELDPLAFENGMSGGSPNTLLYLDRPDDFLAVLPTLEMPYFRYYRGYVAFLQGREEDARRTLEPAYRDAPGEIFGRMSQALLAILNGENDRAQEIVIAISRQREALGAVDSEITFKQAQLLSLAGDRSGAFEELAKSVDQGFSCPRCLLLDPALNELREAPELDDVLNRARKSHLALARRFRLEDESRESG